MLQIDEMMDGETNDICGYDVMGQVFGIWYEINEQLEVGAIWVLPGGNAEELEITFSLTAM